MADQVKTCQVLVTQPIDKNYDYLIPDHMDIEPGDYVLVPLGPRQVTGLVWALNENGPEAPSKKLKSILHKFDLPPMSGDMRDFIDRAAKYNMIERGHVLKMAMPIPAAMEKGAGVKAYAPGAIADDALLTEKQKKVVALLKDQKPRKLADITKGAGVTQAIVKTLEKSGALKIVEMARPAPCRNPDLNHGKKVLNSAQKEIAGRLKERIAQGGYEAYLLDGITGSGKTETYFEAVAAALKLDKQVVILLPEIALSNAFIERFKERFNCAPALWHSSLTPAQRKLTWRGIANGETRVVVGARSALFLPYPDLGLLIVDEEHDNAFKQEENGIYNARDMAILRANLSEIPIILVSATPSLETMQNVWNGKYTHLELPARYGDAAKPDVKIVDMRLDKPERQHFISPVLKDAIERNISRGEQALLFLNRRGYAPLTLCRTCGYRFECPRCTAWLVEHKKIDKLQCHHCGYDMRLPEICPSCGDVHSFAACGPGVERIAEEVKEYFPEARSLILASDVTDSPEKINEALNAIHNHDVDIIIGTQIIAKGHHFPKLTCVGIVDADLGLSGGDLRATEKSFHLLHQVAGRAGREKLKGEVYVQTFNPQHRVMQTLANDDRDEFLRVEAEERERAHMPPFTRLVALILASENEDLVRKTSEEVVRKAPAVEGIGILGPAQAQMYRIRGKYRYRVLIRAEKNLNVQKYLSEWLDPIRIPSAVRLAIDVDPQSFL